MVVSTGAPKVAVPDVVHGSASAAIETLQGSGFVVVTTEVPSNEVEAGHVAWQSISGTADQGATIEIGVSTGPEVVVEPTPQVTPTPTTPTQPTETETGAIGGGEGTVEPTEGEAAVVE